MLLYIVDRAEVATQEIVEKYSIVASCGIHKNKLARMDKVSLITEDDLLTITTVRGRANWIESGTSVGLMQVTISERLDFVSILQID